jgi:putative membrane protein
MFTAEDEKRIEAAIAAAERRTSGEILAVVARESSTYAYAPLLWASALALLVPWPLIFFTWLPVQLIYAIQLALFLGLALAGFTRPLRYALVPGYVKRERAHRRAVEQFLAQNLHTTKGRTGVLIFVSVAERYAEVIADFEILKRVPKESWQVVVDTLVTAIGEGRAADGFVAAVDAAGAHLAAHFPPGSADPDELPNHLIVLD